ncbi:unnamed protein product [Prorocentrum cordatum]|uniref:Uncharacterized protein n=1 Tax=Prorocentrum cordatum TaxID=2364126 RepID=A0ABN9Q8U4_9DINO|nr:unnamed protein product [Polarella glacialis]
MGKKRAGKGGESLKPCITKEPCCSPLVKDTQCGSRLRLPWRAGWPTPPARPLAAALFLLSSLRGAACLMPRFLFLLIPPVWMTGSPVLVLRWLPVCVRLAC